MDSSHAGHERIWFDHERLAGDGLRRGGVRGQHAAWIDAFPTLLAEISLDGRPDLHVGAISPDMGTQVSSGAFGPSIPGSVGGCSLDGDAGVLRQSRTDIHDRYLIDSADATNHPASLAQDMTAILELGSAGCGYQQHLAAIRAAFASTLNAGFRRDDAALGIVVVSDEDDCSALDPSLFDRNASTLGALQHFRCIQFGVRCAEADMTTYGPRTDCRPNPDSTIIEDPADFVPVIQALAHDRRRVAVAAVVGDNEVAIEGRAPSGGTAAVPSLVHSCEWIGPNSNAIVADPAVRLTSLAEQFDDRGTVASICDTDLTRAATTIGIGLRRAMGDSCIEDDLDLASCSVVDQLGTIETKLPACNGATTACYDVITDEAACPHAAHHKLAVHHDAAPGTYTLVRC